MNFFSKTSHKILIDKRLFYGFLITSLLVVILIIISGLLSLISQEQFNLFVVQKKLENVSTNDAFNQFRFETLIKIFTNSIVIIFFAIYVFFAHTKIKIGYIFVTFWSFIWVANILSAWLLLGELWYSITTTIISIIVIIQLFYLFVLLYQNNFYEKNIERW